MSDWPDKSELLRIIDVPELDPGDPLDTVLDDVIDAAISRVKDDVGNWDDSLDFPDAALAQAARVAAEHYALRPAEAGSTISDPRYLRLLKGHRRRFGIS